MTTVATPTPARRAAIPATDDEGGPLLLVVDDDDATRQLLRTVLARRGYRVVEAASGEEGLRRFATERPALVLLDVMMPGLDGFETCRRLRAIDPDETPVIMLTGADDYEAVDQAFASRATDFVAKPIRWPLLLPRIRFALRADALQRAVRRNRVQQDAARRIARLAFLEWAVDTGALRWADDAAATTGIPDLPATVEALVARCHAEDGPRVQRALLRLRDDRGRDAEPLELDFRLLAADGERIVRLVGRRGDAGADHDVVYAAFQDVTASRRTEALVDHLAFHDELTDLGNRRLFARELAARVQALRHRPGHVLLVGWIDLTRFQRHNDALGDALGDQLLRRFAKRLTRLLPTHAAASRMGGDEFALLLEAPDRDEAMDRFDALLGELRRPYDLGERECFLHCTAGVAVVPEHGTDPATLVALAQEAQRAARRTTRAVALAGADAAVTTRSSRLLDLERALHDALPRGELSLAYQPQLDLRHGRIVGAEALLRWTHPTLGLVPPAEFVPLLEESGLIDQVGQWVLDAACRQLAAWDAEGLHLRLGVNLSPRQFLDPDLVDRIEATLALHAVAAGRLELEITEGLTIHDPAHTTAVLERFAGRGIRVAIDDFGIGHSSLEYVLRFPIDVIKLDRAFVRNVTTDRADRAIVRAATVMAQEMGLHVIAEGVETLRQADFLEALGVREIQGFLVGRPMDAAALAALARTARRPGADHEG